MFAPRAGGAGAAWTIGADGRSLDVILTMDGMTRSISSFARTVSMALVVACGVTAAGCSSEPVSVPGPDRTAAKNPVEPTGPSPAGPSGLRAESLKAQRHRLQAARAATRSALIQEVLNAARHDGTEPSEKIRRLLHLKEYEENDYG
ncbi:hypothetical protein [Planotetraspora sp. GP83]|uniref:hypothetical protein n=1 Tax=Planotetraspora sp. GP83 TaxID=3156264 RepID=UPI003510F07B